MIDFGLPPKLAKPALILPKPADIIRPGDPRFVVPGMFVATGLSGFGAGVTAGEGNDSFTTVLLHCDGADGSTTFTNSAAGGTQSVTAVGNAQIDTAQFKFGGASGLFDGTGDYITVPDHADTRLTGDFTIDFWVRYNVASGTQVLCSRGDSNNSNAFWLLSDGSTLKFQTNNSVAINGSFVNATATWYHIACTRSGSSLRLFVDGSQVGSTATNSSSFNAAITLRFGADDSGLRNFNGWLDEIRLSNGVARWTSTFTPPTAAYG